MKKIDWGHPDWILAAMWWCGFFITLIAAPKETVGLIALGVFASFRTYIVYLEAKR